MNTLDNFGKVYINQVRDNSLFLLDAIITGHMKDNKSQLLHNQLKNLSDKEIELIHQLSIYLIDNTLHNVLFLFEEYPEWKLIDENQNNLAELSDGLSGELYTENGWIKKFSSYS